MQNAARCSLFYKMNCKLDGFGQEMKRTKMYNYFVKRHGKLYKMHSKKR